MKRRADSSDKRQADGGIHAHPHRHADHPAAHRHPHHHVHEPEGIEAHAVARVPMAHDHGHGLSFERYTWIVSPIHSLDPRAKILASLAIVLAVVLGGPPKALELVLLAAFLLGAAAAAHVPATHVLARSLLVVPFAGMIALFAPLQGAGTGSLSASGLASAYLDGGWVIAYSIIAKAWLATLTVVVLAATTPVPRLIKGLEALRVPDVILMLVTFVYRYVASMRDRIEAMRRTIASRAPSLSRWNRVRLYGNLAGTMFLRAYDQGERVHQAMLARGYSGTIPTGERLSLSPADLVALIAVGSAVAALAIY